MTHSDFDRSRAEPEESGDGRRDMIIGGLTCIGGIAVTVASYSIAPNIGGSYVIAWGAVLFGAFRLVRGAVAFGASRQFWGIADSEFIKKLDRPQNAVDKQRKKKAASTPPKMKVPPKIKVPPRLVRYVLLVWLGLMAVAVVWQLAQDS